MPNLDALFAELPQRFQADKAGDMSATIQFNLSGDDGGNWYVKINDGTCVTEEGKADNPEATINMAASDFADMMSGQLNPMAAFMSGKIKVEGDLNTVMKFQPMFGL